jgi:DNA-binding CsgD family transcriptional regulator
VLSSVVVLLAALLLGGTAATIAAVVQIAILIVAAIVEASGHALPLGKHEPFSASAAVAPALLLGLVTRSCWIYTRDVLTSIDDMVAHGSETSPLRQLRTKTLSVREIEVVQLAAEGLSNDAIAKRLFLSPRTVQSHVANAMGKSGSANRTELGVLAIREGLVPIAAPAIRPADELARAAEAVRTV